LSCHSGRKKGGEEGREAETLILHPQEGKREGVRGGEKKEDGLMLCDQPFVTR